MLTILEVFYLRIMDDKVYYQRKQANLSIRGGDPNRRIQSLILEKRNDAKGYGKIKKKQLVVRSTSWR